MIKKLKSFWIRHHAEECPACQSRLLSREEARALLVQPGEMKSNETLWTDIVSRIRDEERAAVRAARRPGPKLLLAMAAASLVIAMFISFWSWRGYQSESAFPAEDHKELFYINYLKVGDEPAQAFIFQPHDSPVIIVWAEKSYSKGGCHE